MKAILLAAGLGTRLRPFTLTQPKCLAPINGKPLLGHWIESLVEVGISDILVNTHYFSEQVKDYIATHPLHRHVSIFHEAELLGTAGTFRETLAFWSHDDVMVIHADNYCVCDWKQFFAVFRQRPEYCVGTMLLFHTDRPKECGIVQTDSSGVVQAFYEKIASPPSNLASGAIFLFSPKIVSELDQLQEERPDISLHLIPRLIGRLNTWEIKGYLSDIGTPESLRLAQNSVNELMSVKSEGNLQPVIKLQNIELTPIAIDDLETVRQWRNDPSISRFMLTQQEITPKQQQAWFNKVHHASDQRHFVISYKGDKIGVANIKTLEGEAIARRQVLETGIYIADSRYRGTVLAFFPALALNDYCFNELMCEKLVANVLADNMAALRFNETMGYKVVMQGDVIQMQLTHEDYVQSTTGLRRLIR